MSTATTIKALTELAALTGPHARILKAELVAELAEHYPEVAEALARAPAADPVATALAAVPA